MQQDIRIGTLVRPDAAYIRQVLEHGFESISITFWQKLDGCDLKKLARAVKQAIGSRDIKVSSLGMFGNPLETRAIDQETRDGWKALIAAAPWFECDLVCGFAGRRIDQPIPASLKAFKKVFTPLAKQAQDQGVRLAFENCDMGGSWDKGDWNIAQYPAAWELMFDALPFDNVGLEWEPCHQMVKLIDPVPQLRQWVGKVFHVHGKDASIHWDVLRQYGFNGPKPWAFHRTPGFGDSNWTDLISILRQGGFKGSIDIEGWHDPVYRDALEMTGQVHALQHLRNCRGGAFIPNPV